MHVLGAAPQTGLGMQLQGGVTQSIAIAWELKGLEWWCDYFSEFMGTRIFSQIVAWGEKCKSEVV